MKTIKLGLFTVILMMAFSTLLLVSCDKDDEEVEVVKTELQNAITAANSLISSTTEGTADGQYLPGSKAVFQTVIDAAQVVYDNLDATQIEVDNTVIALAAATDAYNANIVEAIAPDALMGHWTFDEGSGTTLADFSGNSFNGTFMDGSDGHGGGLPTWTTDRYGNTGGALMFNLGARVIIPYNSALNPENLSISVWVNAAEVLENNRFIGLYSWHGYKFQLQSANKAFFTIATTDGIYDRDTDPPLEIDTWYHLVVTFGGGEMAFYINGTQTKLWDNTPGTAIPIVDHDIAFGTGNDVTPSGYFHGAMDEVRMYNTVLSAAQVLTIYELEKVAD